MGASEGEVSVHRAPAGYDAARRWHGRTGWDQPSVARRDNADRSCDTLAFTDLQRPCRGGVSLMSRRRVGTPASGDQKAVAGSAARKSASELARGNQRWWHRGEHRGLEPARDLARRFAQRVALLPQTILQRAGRERRHERGIGRDLLEVTRAQICLCGTDGVWDVVPRRAVTVGMREILASRHIHVTLLRSWHAGLWRQALLGPVTGGFPASFLQEHPNVQVTATRLAAALPGLHAALRV